MREDGKVILTRFYLKHDGIGVTTVSKRSHSNMIPRIWLEGSIAIHLLLRVGRDLLAVGVLTDRIFDSFYVTVINDVAH